MLIFVFYTESNQRYMRGYQKQNQDDIQDSTSNCTFFLNDGAWRFVGESQGAFVNRGIRLRN